MPIPAIDSNIVSALPDRLLRPQEAADLLGVTVGTLNTWRSTGNGPAFVKLAPGKFGRVRYGLKALVDYINSRERTNPVSLVA